MIQIVYRLYVQHDENDEHEVYVHQQRHNEDDELDDVYMLTELFYIDDAHDEQNVVHDRLVRDDEVQYLNDKQNVVLYDEVDEIDSIQIYRDNIIATDDDEPDDDVEHLMLMVSHDYDDDHDEVVETHIHDQIVMLHDIDDEVVV